MAHYGSGSPKRQKCFSNNRSIGAVNLGKLDKASRSELTVKTTVRTKGGGYQGSSELKNTQSRGCTTTVFCVGLGTSQYMMIKPYMPCTNLCIFLTERWECWFMLF